MKRKIIKSMNTFQDETYRCVECEKSLQKNEVTNDWKCIYCKTSIVISAPLLDQEVIRKLPQEITTNDLFFLNHESHIISNKTKMEKGDYEFILKNYGTYKLGKETFAHIVY
ncbi:MAG: hypothetical protein ACE3L7_32700 [Candidatus Pristimantibacillus sp.]